MTITQINRIRDHQITDFFQEYVIHEKPVIIENGYDGQKISRFFDDQEMLKAEFGSMQLLIGEIYFDESYSEKKYYDSSKILTLSEYFDLIDRDSALKMLCREQVMPNMMRSTFELPRHTHSMYTGPLSSVCYVYAARDGLVAPLHFDKDQREVLFTQLLGKKRIFLVNPIEAGRLFPIQNASGIPVHRLSPSERENFFSYVSAYECTLSPGETLYMPKLWWHHLENIGTTMAFNVRMGLQPANCKLNLLPMNFMLQNLSRKLIDPIYGVIEPEIYNKLFHVYFGYYNDHNQKLMDLVALYREAFERFCPLAMERNTFPDWFYHLLKTDLKHYAYWFNYEKPSVELEDGDLSGKCSKRTLKIVKKMTKDAGCTGNYLNRLCLSLGIDFKGFDKLTLLEAHIICNQCCQYKSLNAPGLPGELSFL